MRKQSWIGIFSLAIMTSACATKQIKPEKANEISPITLIGHAGNPELISGKTVRLAVKLGPVTDSTEVSWYTQHETLCDWNAPDAQAVSKCEFSASPRTDIIYVEMRDKTGQTITTGWRVDLQLDGLVGIE